MRELSVEGQSMTMSIHLTNYVMKCMLLLDNGNSDDVTSIGWGQWK